MDCLGIEYLSGDATDEDELQRLQETSLVTISLYPVEQEVSSQPVFTLWNKALVRHLPGTLFIIWFQHLLVFF